MAKAAKTVVWLTIGARLEFEANEAFVKEGVLTLVYRKEQTTTNVYMRLFRKPKHETTTETKRHTIACFAPKEWRLFYVDGWRIIDQPDPVIDFGVEEANA